MSALKLASQKMIKGRYSQVVYNVSGVIVVAYNALAVFYHRVIQREDSPYHTTQANNVLFHWYELVTKSNSATKINKKIRI